MTTTIPRKLQVIGVSALLSVAVSFPGSAHDCDKKHDSKEDAKASHMMMQDKDHMKGMHEKMMAKMKACMAKKMEKEKEQSARELKHKMMGHMEACMNTMKQPADDRKDHQHDDEKPEKEHKH